MNNKYLIVAILVAVSTVLIVSYGGSSDKTVLDYNVRGIVSSEMNPIELADYKQNVLLIVNTPTECGHWDEYAKLNNLYIKYHEKGLQIVAFPSGSFDYDTASQQGQATFCPDNYRVVFPMIEKTDVNGSNIHPVYSFLTEPQTNPEFSGAIRSDFEKFLIGRGGNVIARFSPDIEPDDPAIIAAIEKAL